MFFGYPVLYEVIYIIIKLGRKAKSSYPHPIITAPLFIGKECDVVAEAQIDVFEFLAG